jgi:4-amino-4-deoxy-L-arabinose transferase-like glycosyltransferase
MKEKTINFLKYFLPILLLLFPVFGHLGALPIQLWDESRLALNALEMFENGDYLVTFYDGAPDLWNTKPPMLIWMQVLSLKLFGISEASLRFPSALAALGTLMIILAFAKNYLKNYTLGFVAFMVLLTTFAYIDVHSTRTADYDALLTMFTTLACLSWFIFLESKRKVFVLGFFIALSFAVLTKGITALIFMPAVFIYTLFQKELVNTLKNKQFYLGLGIFVLAVFGYYGIREFESPSYLAAVQMNELGGRYLEALEGHRHGFWFYYQNILEHRINEWYLLIPVGAIIGLVAKNQRIKRLTTFLLLLVLFYFLVISSAQTKLQWYDVPMYPFIALIIALPIYMGFEYLKRVKVEAFELNKQVLPFLFLFIVFIGPYRMIIDKTYKPQVYEWEKSTFELSYYLRDALRGHHNLNGQFILDNSYHAHLEYYTKLLEKDGQKVGYKDVETLSFGDIVFTHIYDTKVRLVDLYNFERLYMNGAIETYKILGPKTESND